MLNRDALATILAINGQGLVAVPDAPYALKLLSDARLFVFQAALSPSEETRTAANGNMVRTPLDLPFDNCWFELGDKHSIATVPIHDGTLCKVIGLQVLELDSSKYGVVIYMARPDGVMAVGQGTCEVGKVCDGWIVSVLECARFYLNELQHRPFVGYSQTRAFKVYPQGVARIKFGARDVIYVGARKLSQCAKVVSGHAVEWTHSWAVMGHWRHVPSGFGHNRYGDPIRTGFTWVKPHVRGDGELKKKKRVVNNSLAYDV